MTLSDSPFVCFDCGDRSAGAEPCERCHEPRLDLRSQQIVLAALDDDERRRAKRDQQLISASVPLAMLLVLIAQTALGDSAALVPGLRGFLGYIVWGIIFAVVLRAGLGKLFPAERRFPYLAAHMVAEPSSTSGIGLGTKAASYRDLAAPSAALVPEPFEPATSHGKTITWAYLVVSLVSFSLFIALSLSLREQIVRAFGAKDIDTVSPISLGLGAVVASVVAGLLGLFWVHASFRAIPEQFRVANDGRMISPHDAAVNMLIPFYNFYWIFYAHAAFCDAVNGQLVRLGGKRRAPKTLAMVACGVYLVPYINLALAPFFWFVYMLLADRAKEEMLVLLRAEQSARFVSEGP